MLKIYYIDSLLSILELQTAGITYFESKLVISIHIRLRPTCRAAERFRLKGGMEALDAGTRNGGECGELLSSGARTIT